MSANTLYQKSYTISEGLSRQDLKKGIKFFNMTDLRFFYKMSDNRIMMAICRGTGKNRDKYEAVCYNGVMTDDDTFVIKDAEPIDEPIWFDDKTLFNEFLKDNGLLNAEFTPVPSSKTVPVMAIDDTIPRLWEDFRELNKGQKRKGCWVTEFTDVRTKEDYSTGGDIHKNTSWKDYFKWLIGDIEEFCDLRDVVITDVYFNGIDEHFED